MGIMKKLFWGIGAVVVVLLGIVCARALMFTPEIQRAAGENLVSASSIIHPDSAALRLGKILSFPTVSLQEGKDPDSVAFTALHDYLSRTYPLVAQQLTKETVNGWSLLYTWKGTDPALKPVLLMAHQDVVPVVPGTESSWTQPPFAGNVADGFIWGRGALDNKSGLGGIFEAMEYHLSQGYKPRRTIYFAFGHDEEIGGRAGNAQVAALLQQRGIQLECVLDEGGLVSEGMIPHVQKPVALVGIAEKGYLSLELRVFSAGGHSSMPPKQTALGILSKAVSALEESPMPTRFGGVFETFLDRTGREASFAYKLAFANLWLFQPLIVSMLNDKPSSSALIRTTTAPTMMSGSPKDNVLPIMATAVVNFRIAPGDSIGSVMEHVKRTIGDARVKIKAIGNQNEPSPVSDIQSAAYKTLEQTIIDVYGANHIITPYLVVGATDSRHYTGLTRNIYRFLPNVLTNDDLQRVHGTDERISVQHYQKSIQFYARIIKRLSE